MWSEGIESYVIQIERDIDGTLWAITQSEVLRSYDDGVLWESVDAVAEGASLRAFVRTADHWAIAGWLSNAAVVWIGSPGGPWTTTDVPFAVGQLMEPLGLGADGQAWFNYPMQSIGTVLRISAVGTIELMAESIGDVAGMMVIDGEHLLATRDGLFRSQDGGIWTAIDDVGLNCVVNHDGSWFGCVDALADVGAVGQWSGDHWQTTLQFADVAGPMDCPVPTDGSAEACDEEWKAVQAAFLLRLDPPTVPQEPKEEHKEEPASSCSLVTGSHKSWWLGLLALAVFRRRHHKARPD